MIDLNSLAGGLIVSCQARPDNPLHGPVFMRVMADAAERGGAVGIRAEGVADISAIRSTVQLPIIGIRKVLDGREVYITPTYETAKEISSAGADIVAIDATDRPREGGVSAAELIKRIRGELDIRVMADIDNIQNALVAIKAGADLVATTLSGYTMGTTPRGPDLDLVASLADSANVPVIAEGRLWTEDDIHAAFQAGAWAVVVGTAITNPTKITARLATASPRGIRRGA